MSSIKSKATSGIIKNFTSTDVHSDTLFPLNDEDPEWNGTSGISTADTSSKTNTRTEKLHSAVLDFCTENFKTLADIAKGVSRTKGHLKKHVIPALLQSGKLVRKHPDVPNHPDI